MHVITKRRLKDFYENHKDSKRPLLTWLMVINSARYENFAELLQTFPSADQVGSCTVFDIGENKYRLITIIHYNTGKIFVRKALTHKEYDKGTWKKDCKK